MDGDGISVSRSGGHFRQRRETSEHSHCSLKQKNIFRHTQGKGQSSLTGQGGVGCDKNLDMFSSIYNEWISIASMIVKVWIKIEV